MKIGLVLGGGGLPGQAYHAAVLAALEHDLGWDPRTADIIVGTSAGAITGALLRAGVPAHDLARWTVQGPLSTEGRILSDLFGNEFPELAPFRLVRFLRPPRLPSWALLRRLLLRPGRLGSASTLLTLLAPGKWDVREHLAPFRELGQRGWPSDNLWICAVRQGDGQRVVFGRPGSPEVPLHLAVAASCAVPGYFAPVAINGISYLDGGVHSANNAEVLRHRGIDLVIIVSPMSGHAGVPMGMAGLVRHHATRSLHREIRALKAAALEVVVFEPSAAVLSAMGCDLLSRDRLRDIIREGFLAAGQHAAGFGDHTTFGRVRTRRSRNVA